MTIKHPARALRLTTALAVFSTLSAAVLANELGAGNADATNKELIEAARLTPDVRRGEALFETCAACHGKDGLGTTDGSVPAVAGQHGSVLLKQLVDFRHEQRRDERMQHFTDQHHLETAQDLIDLSAYLARLPRFAPRNNAIGTGEYLQLGGSVYFRACENCHGPLGEGDPNRFRPRVAGQHYEYLLKQLNDIASESRPAMHPRHVERIRALTTTERMGIADYLSRVSPERTSHTTTKVSRH